MDLPLQRRDREQHRLFDGDARFGAVLGQVQSFRKGGQEHAREVVGGLQLYASERGHRERELHQVVAPLRAHRGEGVVQRDDDCIEQCRRGPRETLVELSSERPVARIEIRSDALVFRHEVAEERALREPRGRDERPRGRVAVVFVDDLGAPERDGEEPN